jgi:hypothetical protein
MSDSKSTVYGFTSLKDLVKKTIQSLPMQLNMKKEELLSTQKGHTRLASFFASGNYAYDNKYLFDFSYRLDGSSQFGTKKKTAPFYSCRYRLEYAQREVHQRSESYQSC